MKRLPVTIPLLALALLFVQFCDAQAVVQLSLANASVQKTNLLQYARNKKLPAGYEEEALTALSYFPELQNVRIRFRIKKSRALMKTKPSFFSLFMPRGHRTYVIVISDRAIRKIRPLLVANMPEEARIGAMGHELSHIVDFYKKSSWQCFKSAVRHISASYLDSFEYNTDRICIRHGMGAYLMDWSGYIRSAMHIHYWRGSAYARRYQARHERYMNPSSITSYMALEANNPDSTIKNAH